MRHYDYLRTNTRSSKQVTISFKTLIVRTRLLVEHRDEIEKVIVTCNGETGVVFYRYPEKALKDPELPKTIDGYSVEDLKVLADICNHKGITAIELKTYTEGVKDGYNIARWL